MELRVVANIEANTLDFIMLLTWRFREHKSFLTLSTTFTSMQIMIVGLRFYRLERAHLHSINGAHKSIWIALKRSYPERSAV